jgi:hypothetical protein
MALLQNCSKSAKPWPAPYQNFATTHDIYLKGKSFCSSMNRITAPPDLQAKRSQGDLNNVYSAQDPWDFPFAALPYV